MKKFFILDSTNSQIWTATPFARNQNVIKDEEIDRVLDGIRKFFEKSVVTPRLIYALFIIKKQLILLVRIGVISDEESRQSMEFMLKAGFEERKLVKDTSFTQGIVLEDFASYVYGVVTKG